LLLALVPAMAQAQETFAGTWTVIDAQAAPWVDAAAAEPQADPALRGGTITFAADRVDGPPPFGCTQAHYEVKKVGPEFLFQGGLTDPGAQAAALGFIGDDITALSLACVRGEADVSMDFALVDADTAVFALDNIIYRMRRSP
jgi:hypothetical protein